MEKEFHIVKSELSALKKKFEQIEREQQLKEKDGQNISKPIISDNLPQLNKQINTDKENNKFNNTIYQVKDNNAFSAISQFNNTQKKFNMTHTEKKSWKDTKLYKGNSLSSFRDNRNDAIILLQFLKKKQKLIIHQ